MREAYGTGYALFTCCEYLSLINRNLVNLTFFLHALCTVSGFDVDEYVRRSYKFAYSDCVEVAPVSCSPDPPDPSELYMTKSSR